MMRSLWTAATGMKAQQTSVDTISNNLANVNTTAYKAQQVQFKSLLYQTLQTQTTTSNGDPKPTQAQVGLGTRVASTNSSFRQGNEFASDNPSALFIQGEGFFQIRAYDGNVYYTRDGDFHWTLNADNQRVLANNDGYMVLDTEGNPIVLPDRDETGRLIKATDVIVDEDGTVSYYMQTEAAVGENNETVLRPSSGTLGQIALYQFSNNTGLDKMAGNLYEETEASGEATLEENMAQGNRSSVVQGYLEGSNVDVANEMVNMIISQRAYELNSKAITTSDSMLETANNLRR